MAFTIIREDLARVQADAIVVPANQYLTMTGGTGLAVAKAAGYRRLTRACKRLGGCRVGKAVATPAYKLQADHIIHAVGPMWRGGGSNEAELLRSAYDSALGLALRLNAQSVALPLLSAGTFGYPIREAFEIAVEAIRAFTETADMDVILVLYDKRAVTEGSRVFGEIAEYIDDAYAEGREWGAQRLNFRRRELEELSLNRACDTSELELAAPAFAEPELAGYAPAERRSAEPELAERRSAAPESAATYCPRCGNPHPTGYPYCAKCGYAFTGAQSPRYAPDSDKGASFAAPADSAFAHGYADSYIGAAPSAPDASYSMPLPTAAGRRKPAKAPHLPVPKRGSTYAPAPVYAPAPASAPAPNLNALLAQMDAPFSAMLLQLIDERGLTDAQVYKRANISRQHFSKMRNPDYRPSKKTVVALAVALELPLPAARELLARAGFALTHSDKFDIIVEYFISRGEYDIFAINEVLFAYDQPLLN